MTPTLTAQYDDVYIQEADSPRAYPAPPRFLHRLARCAQGDALGMVGYGWSHGVARGDVQSGSLQDL